MTERSLFRQKRPATTFTALLAGVVLSGPVLGASTEDARKQGIACDPYRGQIDQAEALLRTRKVDGATQILNSVLAADKTNIVGNFLIGTIELAKAGAGHQQYGLQQVQLAASMISSRPASCAKLLGWYSIYVTLGAQYYNHGDRTNAKKYLDMAYVHRADLGKNTRQVLFDDLGRVALSEGDFANALFHYAEAQREGSKSASASIALVKRLQSKVP